MKLYSAIKSRPVHFRLLHARDKVPVRQQLVNPETNAVVPYAETRRAWQTAEGELVMLKPEELEALVPESTRNIQLRGFFPSTTIDHRWYDRPYYLGPDADGDTGNYTALVGALEAEGVEGLASWVMRKKAYIGALRVYRGHPVLISLRHADQVVLGNELRPPTGRAPAKRELEMARKLVAMLESDFEPEEYRNEYRERVMDMLERKRKGGRIVKKPVKAKQASPDLAAALESSLESVRKRA
nr:Ku protein [Kineobactrum salinum]